MPFPERTQAILLLTAHFSKPKKGDATPLSIKEYGRFAQWLSGQTLNPERLLKGNLRELIDGWNDNKVSSGRLEALLNRGAALALASEKWQRAGLWVITRSDTEYPELLRLRLKSDCPPILFGCGNRRLLNQKCIAAVGSRNAGEEDLKFCRSLGELVSKEGMSIASGGARGVDEATMLGALVADGTAVGVLSNGLLRATSSAKYRKYVTAKNLVLISPFYPEAGFNVGNAMARNKYIYCLSAAAVVVHSGLKGGTWSGAIENLRHNWVPLWIKKSKDDKSGNSQLVERGGAFLSENIEDITISSLILDGERNRDLNGRGSHISASEEGREDQSQADITLTTTGVTEGRVERASGAGAGRGVLRSDDGLQSQEEHYSDDAAMGFYELFLLKIESACLKDDRSRNDLSSEFGISKVQLDKWLKRAIEEKKLKKLSKPVRYRWIGGSAEQRTLW